MNDYTCEKCDEKEQIIQNNEKRIIDLTDLIKKRSILIKIKPEALEATPQLIRNQI